MTRLRRRRAERPAVLSAAAVTATLLLAIAATAPAGAEESAPTAALAAATDGAAGSRDGGSPAADTATGAGGTSTAADASLPSARAIFAGGCFWCVEAAFDEVPGVVRTTSGFVGGRTENPTYDQVSAGGTGHAEAVEVIFDPERTDYAHLLEVFWHNVDPFAAGRQFCDVGDQYRSAIFWLDEEQHRAALASKAALEKEARFRGRIATEIVPAGRFWPAEEYHQDYHRKNAVKYRYYRWSCGRDARLRDVWGEAAPH